MARKVGEQDVKHVVVDCDMVHITIVIIGNSLLQIPCEPNTMMREMPLKESSRIRWGRVVAAAVLSEALVIAVLVATTTAYRFLIAPGRTAAEYDAFGELAGYYMAPAAAGFATFFGALWVGRKLTSAFRVNGALVGVAAVVLTAGFLFAARPEDRLMYGVSYVLRMLGGYLGGAVAQRMSIRRLASLPTLGEAG
jgi:hypothetical protein